MIILMVVLLVVFILAGPVLSAVLYWQGRLHDRRTMRTTLLRYHAAHHMVWCDVSTNHHADVVVDYALMLMQALHQHRHPVIAQADGYSA